MKKENSDVIFIIGNDNSILKITKTTRGLTILCGVETMGWGETLNSTLDEVLKNQRTQIINQLNSLDKTNRASKKGLEYLLSELTKVLNPQLTLKL